MKWQTSISNGHTRERIEKLKWMIADAVCGSVAGVAAWLIIVIIASGLGG